MTGAFIATCIVVYLVIVWWLKDSPEPTHAETEWRRAQQGRVAKHVAKQNVTRPEKRWL